MTSKSKSPSFAASVLLLLLATVPLTAALDKQKAAPGAELFTNGPPLHISVKMEKAAIESLRRDHRKDVRATVSCEGVTYRDVAVHVKGSMGSLRDIGNHPALTLHFSKNLPKQRFHGLEKIHLNNSVQDRGLMDEILCGELFRVSGVPAARASRVVVELNGAKDRLYVLKEGFNKDLLGQYFADPSGNLYDGGFVAEIGENSQKMCGHGPDDKSDLKKLLAACREPDLEKRWRRMNTVLDVNRFLAMMAMEVLTVHWDGYSLKRNNYRVYFNPADGKAVFLVHGMDQMFGKDGDANLDIMPDFDGVVAASLMEIPEARQLYLARLQAQFNRHFNKSLTDRVEELAVPVRAELAGNRGALDNYNQHVDDLKTRIRERIASVRRQLDKL